SARGNLGAAGCRVGINGPVWNTQNESWRADLDAKCADAACESLHWLLQRFPDSPGGSVISMRQKKRLGQRALFWGLASVIAVACLITTAGGPSHTNYLLASGGPRLVSVQPLPQMDVNGPMCQWQPAAANAELMAALMQSSGAAGSGADARNLVRD